MDKKSNWLIRGFIIVGIVIMIVSIIIVFGWQKKATSVNNVTSVNTSDNKTDNENVDNAVVNNSDENLASNNIEAQENDGLPPSLIELKNKYPETADFVDSYPEYIGIEYNSDIDLSEDVTEGEIPLFIQWDKRWGYYIYGNDFFGVNGCGPTCLAMVICGLTNDTVCNPYEVALFSMGNGYYIMGQGTSWDLMTKGAYAFGLTVEEGEISEQYIRDNVSENSPMICSMYPGDFTYTGHFIVLTGIDEDGKVIVNDPNSYINSEKHWELEEVTTQIKSLWCYRLAE